MRVNFKPHGAKQRKDIIFLGIRADYFSSLVCTKIFLPAMANDARLLWTQTRNNVPIIFSFSSQASSCMPSLNKSCLLPAVYRIVPFKEREPQRASSKPTSNLCQFSFYGWRFCFILNVSGDE